MDSTTDKQRRQLQEQYGTTNPDIIEDENGVELTDDERQALQP